MLSCCITSTLTPPATADIPRYTAQTDWTTLLQTAKQYWTTEPAKTVESLLLALQTCPNNQASLLASKYFSYDLQKCTEYYRKSLLMACAPEPHDVAEATFRLAQHFQLHNVHASAIIWYRKASSLGHHEASLQLGLLLLASEPAEAYALFASVESPQGSYLQGMCHLMGWATKIDHAAAKAHFERGGSFPPSVFAIQHLASKQ